VIDDGAISRRAALETSWNQRSAHWLDLLRRLVETSSGSDDVDGVDTVRRELARGLAEIGLAVEERAPPADAFRLRGAHLVARAAAPGRRRVLLIGHLDTVFARDDPFRGFRREGDLLRGPGVGDIKGGDVVILAALAALRDAGLLGQVDVTIVMNSDEEVGSQSSRELVRELASRCDLALGFEPAFHPAGESVARHSRVQHVVERKGCGRYAVELTGVAAHSGGAHHLGVSAIEALARKVVEVHALTGSRAGATTNVGLVAGGRSVNTVAPDARAEVDFRFNTAADGEWLAERLREVLERPERVNPAVERPVTCRIEPGGGALWPPLVPSPASLALSGLVAEASRAWGLVAEPIARGGASDAAHAAAVGKPAICGLGPVTSGIHTEAEHTSVAAMREATLVAAELLSLLAEGR
jgi:glutamate carboxypeptidase